MLNLFGELSELLLIKSKLFHIEKICLIPSPQTGKKAALKLVIRFLFLQNNS